MDILGKALLDFQAGNYTEDIKTTSSLDEEDVLPLPYLFRDFLEMPPIEQKALELCKGRILDVGCGSGSHSLYLQEHGQHVTALDQSAGAIEVCNIRGVKKTVCTAFMKYPKAGFDTLLFLMNGIGISGALKNLPKVLHHGRSLLNPGGQMLLDSSNIIYMYEKDQDGGYWIPGDVEYYGDVQFQMGYKTEKGPVFDWLYVDFETLKEYAQKEGLYCELIVKGNHYDYLARLSSK